MPYVAAIQQYHNSELIHHLSIMAYLRSKQE